MVKTKNKKQRGNMASRRQIRRRHPETNRKKDREVEEQADQG